VPEDNDISKQTLISMVHIVISY